MQKQELQYIINDQRQELLSEQNATIPRLTDLDTHLNIPEVTVVTGVRRCGKSTLLRDFIRSKEKSIHWHYLNFEDGRLSRFVVDDFQTAYEVSLKKFDDKPNQQTVIIYDEIQLVEGWERWVAGISAKKNVKVFITGSNSKLLSSELASLLTGRYVPLSMWPFSLKEVVTASNLDFEDFLDYPTTEMKIAIQKITDLYLSYGGFPRAYLAKDTSILSQYYSDIIKNDIALRHRVRNINALNELGAILASQNTRLFNQSAVGRDIQLKSRVTLSKFCHYFLETFLYQELRLYSPSRRKQTRGHFKYYAVDPLMAKQVGFHQSAPDYWILENHVGSELKRRGHNLFYWHSNNNYEVDFIAQSPTGRLTAYQVALDANDPKTLRRELRALQACQETLPIDSMMIVTREEFRGQLETPFPVTILPFYQWALTFPEMEVSTAL